MDVIEVCNSVELSRTRLVMETLFSKVWWLWGNKIHVQVIIERIIFKAKSLWVSDWLYEVAKKGEQLKISSHGMQIKYENEGRKI